MNYDQQADDENRASVGLNGTEKASGAAEGGSSPSAETCSAPGDLANLPLSWQKKLDYSVNTRPGTSQETEVERNESLFNDSFSSPAKNATDKKIFSDSPLVSNQRKEVGNKEESFQTSPLGQRNGAVGGGGEMPPTSGRPKGHLRGTRSNGFCSGPPFAKRPKQRNSNSRQWGSTVDERQKQQQIELIEKEINVMAKESQCGVGKWRPECLQRFATKNWMLFLLCWFCAIQGMLVNGLIPSSISTIERRFHLSTSTIGRIMQFYDFGYVLFCIPVSYFGGRHSKSTVLSAGLALMAFGSFLFTFPHMIAEPFTNTYDADSAGLSKCHDTRNHSSSSSSLNLGGAEFEAITSCPSPENQPGSLRYVFLFCLAHFLHGIGATPLFTIGVSYIDENVGPAFSSLYLGVFYAFAIFGPALGFIASSTFLRYHTDFLQTGQKFASILNLDETDPKWVGAWYLGFMLVSVLALLAVFPILILPKVLPESLKWHRTRLQEETLGAKKRTPECCGMPSSSKTAVIAGSMLQLDDKSASVAVAESMPALKTRSGPIWYQLWLDVRHIPIAIYRILLNGPYMLITLGMAVDGLIVTGCSTFMSKYLERQFGVAPSKANMLIGVVMVPMAGCGTMLAGFLIHHFRMSCVRTLQFCVVLVVCSLMLSPMYFIYCDHDQLVGIERHYPVDDNIANHYDNATEYFNYHLETSCNAQCQCHRSEYHPVCAEFLDGSQVAFYSPCYAGCLQPYNPLQKEYTNCSCAPTTTKGGYRRVKKGFCESKCGGLTIFLLFFAPFCFFTFAVGVALITVVLRTVDYDERSFALGIQWILVRIIGTIPAPVVFGWLFDVSCIKTFHLDPCSGGENGSCMLYHNKSLADLFFAFSVGGQLVAIVCLLSVLLFFSNSLRDDPLPAQPADAPNLGSTEALEKGTADECDVDGYHPDEFIMDEYNVDKSDQKERSIQVPQKNDDEDEGYGAEAGPNTAAEFLPMLASEPNEFLNRKQAI